MREKNKVSRHGRVGGRRGGAGYSKVSGCRGTGKYKGADERRGAGGYRGGCSHLLQTLILISTA